MNKQIENERIKALRSDPDFRALVKSLQSQTPEQLELFYEQYEREEYNEEGADNDKSDV